LLATAAAGIALMFERPASGEKAVLVQLDFGEGDYAERLSEFNLLVGSARAPVGGRFRKARETRSGSFAGKGKVAEIGEWCDNCTKPMSWSSIMNYPPPSSATSNGPSSAAWWTAAA
jgi:hypothetical protein